MLHSNIKDIAMQIAVGMTPLPLVLSLKTIRLTSLKVIASFQRRVAVSVACRCAVGYDAVAVGLVARDDQVNGWDYGVGVFTA